MDSIMTISDYLTPRDEVSEGQFQGVLQAHKVGDDETRLENDADRLFSMTYPSNALETAFDHVDNKLRSQDSQGGIALSGPYGSGKSHGLLVLYHMFDSPDIAQSWVDEWGVSLDLPDTPRASIVSTSETDADFIWKPIFENLGREDILDDIKRYPTTEHIERLTDDEPVAIFFDEIETWWESFGDSENEELLERNEFFLQNLFEVANDPQEKLFTFVTLLDKSQDIKRILDRTSPYAVDMNDTGDREQIILHRLFETNQDDVDETAIRNVVSEYVDHYNFPIEIDEPKRYENRMVETYPFHPELLDLLDDIYEAGRERQSVRGVMNVLAEAAIEQHGTFDDEMSAVEFLRRVKRMESLPYDVTVRGLDDLLRGANDPLEACDYVHGILRDHVNFLLTENPRVQFVVEGLEYWDEPILRNDDNEIPLVRIFHGIEQEGSGWYYSNINVQS